MWKATELKEFLTYMEETKQDNAKNESLKKIHGMVEQVKGDGKASVEYMKIFDLEQPNIWAASVALTTLDVAKF